MTLAALEELSLLRRQACPIIRSLAMLSLTDRNQRLLGWTDKGERSGSPARNKTAGTALARRTRTRLVGTKNVLVPQARPATARCRADRGTAQAVPPRDLDAYSRTWVLEHRALHSFRGLWPAGYWRGGRGDVVCADRGRRLGRLFPARAQRQPLSWPSRRTSRAPETGFRPGAEH